MASKNLLYILTTARCPLSCSFCMTKHLHRNEDLLMNSNALASLKNLSMQTSKVCISGEGDPLAASRSLFKIIANSPPETKFELITSSFWHKIKTEKLLDELAKICVSNNCTLAYRISIDQFHAEEIGHDVLEMLVSIFTVKTIDRVQLQIRSVTGQEEYLFERLHRLFNSRQISYSIVVASEIEYELISDNVQIKIQFKPTVFPGNFDYTDTWPIDRYISFLEKSRKSNFHIGLLNDSISEPAFDLTINPDGTVVLYGAEPFILGNLTQEIFTYDLVRNRVYENSHLFAMISTRFIDLINAWRQDNVKSELIERVNNPFWIVRNLLKDPSRLMLS